MGKFRITSPDGRVFDVEAPEGATQEDVLARVQAESSKVAVSKPSIQTPQKPPNLSLAEAGSQAIGNLPSSFGKLVSGTVESIVNPLDTIDTLATLGAGEITKMLPSSVNTAIKKADVAIFGKDLSDKVYSQEAQLADATNKFYKDRYGSYDGFKRALAEDPAGVLADASIVFGGVGAAAKALGLEKAGAALNVASKYTNPLLPVQKGVELAGTGLGKLTTNTLGVTTGTGQAPKIAYESGKAGNKSFWENMTAGVEPEKVVSEAKSALENIRQDRNKVYQSNMTAIKTDKKILSFDDIDNAYKSALNKFGKTEYGEVRNPDAVAKLSQVKDAIDSWKNNENPALAHTVQGFDDLKQRIGSIMDNLSFNTQERSAVESIYNATKKTIQTQAPTYAKVMKDYAKASDLINEIQKGLSLNKKASVDTSLRKLLSITKDNVQTNYGQRLNLAKELENASGKDIIPAIAGQSMKGWQPRGLGGQLETWGGLFAALTNPSVLLAAPAAMPQFVGATMYGTGKLAAIKDKIMKRIPLTAEEARQAALLGSQTQNATGLLGE